MLEKWAGERKKKERSGGNVSRHYKVYTKKAKQVGVVGDDSLTGPLVAGRLDETTASTRYDSASLSGSVFEVHCNTVVVADGRESDHILFPVPHSDQRDASGSLFRDVALIIGVVRRI